LTGIYKITNLINNKVYIGQTIDFNKRKKEHINALKGNFHVNKHLQSSWNKYGEKSFKFELVELCDANNLTEREQYWIDFYGGINSKNIYNNRDAGDSGTFSEEVRAKISAKNTGRHQSEETKAKLSKIFKGRHHTEEARKKISEAGKGRIGAFKGKHLSEEHRHKISETMKGRPAHNKGTKLSEETKKKIGDASRGRPGRVWTDEDRQAQSKRLKGRVAWNKGKISDKARKIYQLDMTGNLIKEYPSCMIAASETGFKVDCICRCCRKQRPHAYGYIWRYDKPEI